LQFSPANAARKRCEVDLAVPALLNRERTTVAYDAIAAGVACHMELAATGHAQLSVVTIGDRQCGKGIVTNH